jgi:methionyl-tRNA synthetase
MLGSYFDGAVPEPVTAGAESDLPGVIDDALRRYDEHMVRVQLQPALVSVWEIVARANHYLVEKEPWKLAKDPANRDELASVLYAAAETLRVLAVAVSPIMPRAAEALWAQLGVADSLDAQRLPSAGVWGGLAVGTSTTKGASLFPRLEAD